MVHIILLKEPESVREGGGREGGEQGGRGGRGGRGRDARTGDIHQRLPSGHVSIKLQEWRLFTHRLMTSKPTAVTTTNPGGTVGGKQTEGLSKSYVSYSPAGLGRGKNLCFTVACTFFPQWLLPGLVTRPCLGR